MTPAERGKSFYDYQHDHRIKTIEKPDDVPYVNGVLRSKPTVLVVNFSSSWVLSETGAFVPTGKIPITSPVSRQAVLNSASDVPGYLKPKGYGVVCVWRGVELLIQMLQGTLGV